MGGDLVGAGDSLTSFPAAARTLARAFDPQVQADPASPALLRAWLAWSSVVGGTRHLDRVLTAVEERARRPVAPDDPEAAVWLLAATEARHRRSTPAARRLAEAIAARLPRVAANAPALARHYLGTGEPRVREAALASCPTVVEPGDLVGAAAAHGAWQLTGADRWRNLAMRGAGVGLPGDAPAWS